MMINVDFWIIVGGLIIGVLIAPWLTPFIDMYLNWVHHIVRGMI